MITKTQKLFLLLQELSWIKAKNLSQRKVLHKSIHILQEMGLDFRYNFTWYLHGPYCDELSDNIEDIANNEKYYKIITINIYEFKEKSINIINKYKKLIGDNKNNGEWLELVSTILFYKKNYKISDEEIKSEFIKNINKSKFSINLIDQVIPLVNLIDNMKKEQLIGD